MGGINYGNNKHESVEAHIKQNEKEPGEILPTIISLIRGAIYTKKCKIINPNILIGSSLRLRSGVCIKGPGKVLFGNKVTMDISFLRKPCITTFTVNSCVIIGDGCYLGGTRISCVESIEIGKEALLGSATIIDSDIIPTSNISIDNKWIEKHARPIKIGDHFWSGTNAFILKGTDIGDECVLSAGGMVCDKAYPDRSLIVGNPGRRIGATK